LEWIHSLLLYGYLNIIIARLNVCVKGLTLVTVLCYTHSMAMDGKRGNVLNFAAVTSEESMEIRRAFLEACLQRWVDWTTEGRTFKIDDLVRDLDVGGMRVVRFETIRRWINNYEWARDLYMDFLGQTKDHIRQFWLNNLAETLDSLKDDMLHASKPADRTRAKKLYFELAVRFDVFEDRSGGVTKGIRRPHVNLFQVINNYQEPVKYTPTPADAVESDEEVIEAETYRLQIGR
jgi:hypothetical protein